MSYAYVIWRLPLALLAVAVLRMDSFSGQRRLTNRYWYCILRCKYVTMIQWLIYSIDSQEYTFKSAYTMCQQLNLNHSTITIHNGMKRSEGAKKWSEIYKNRWACARRWMLFFPLYLFGRWIAQKQESSFDCEMRTHSMGVSVHLKIISIEWGKMVEWERVMR